MKKHLNYGIALSLLLLPISSMAVGFTWVNWQNTQDWSDGGNWNQEGAVPTAADDTHFNQGAFGVLGAIVSTSNAVTGRLIMDNVVTNTVATGGDLTVAGQTLMGNGGTSVDNVLVVDGGQLDCNDSVAVGGAGAGTLVVNSGTATLNSWLIAGYGAGGSGEVIVNGGSLNVTGQMNPGLNGSGTLTVNGGNVYIGSHLIVAQLGAGTTGDVVINGGETSVGACNFDGVGTTSLTMNGGKLINRGGLAQNANTSFYIATGSEWIFEVSSLADVNWAIDNGAGTWVFEESRSVFENTNGTITVTSVAIPPTEAASIVSSSVSNSVIKIVIDAPSALNYYYPVANSNLTVGTWSNIPHSDDGVNAFVVTNLDYATAEGTNAVIYVQADNAQKYYKISGDQP